MAWSDFPNQQSNSAPKTWASMLIKSQSTIWKHPIKSSNLQVWWFYWMFSQLYKNDYWKKESGSSETNYRVLLWLTCFGGLWVFVAPFSVINICSNHGPNVSFSIYPQFVHRVSLDASLKFILLEDNGSFICNEEFPQKVPLLFGYYVIVSASDYPLIVMMLKIISLGCPLTIYPIITLFSFIMH